MLKLNKVRIFNSLSLNLLENSKCFYVNASEQEVNLLIGYAQFACQDIYEKLSVFENVGFEFTEKNAVDVVKKVFYTEKCVNNEMDNFTLDLFENYEKHSYENNLIIHQNNSNLNNLLEDIVKKYVDGENYELSI